MEYAFNRYKVGLVMSRLSQEKKTYIAVILAIVFFVAVRIFHDSLYIVFDMRNFLSIHIILEFFSICISFAIALQAWFFFPHTKSKQRLYIGITFLSVGLIDLLHTLSYNGMPFFITESSVAKATWFWIMARLTEALGLYMIFRKDDERYESKNWRTLFSFSILYSIIVGFVVIRWSEVLPILVIEGQGVTPLKIGLEYVVAIFHILLIIILLKRYLKSKENYLLTLIVALTFITIGEFVFTLYQSVYDLDNLLGHVYKIIGYYYLLKGIYVTTIAAPFAAEQKAKDNLYESESKFQRVVEYIDDIVIQLDNNLNVIGMYGRFIDKFDLKPNNLIGKSITDLIEDGISGYKEIVEGKIDMIQTEWNGAIDNKEVFLHFSLSPIKNKQDQIIGIVAVGRDLSERKQMELQLQKSYEEAVRASKVKSEFLSTMSHEIRTPMNAILGIADLLKETAATSEQKKYVNLLEKSGNNLLKIINNILDLSKFEAGQMKLTYEPFDNKQLILDICDVVRISAENKGLEIQSSIDPELTDYFVGDADRIRQVISNLVDNAIKFTDKGSITIEVKPYKGNKNGNVLYTVKDTGIGIANEHLDQIFEAFSQVDSTNTRRFGGTGLGLSIAKKFINEMGGEIWVESTVGIGTTFFFTLEIDSVLELMNTDNTINVVQVEVEDSIHTRHILIAEDTEDNRELMKAYLKNTPYEIGFAVNGVEAVEMYKQKKYDLVLMDIQMPEMDGYMATKKIRAFEKEHSIQPIPILALTAHALKESEQKSMEVGCNQHLTKPIKKAMLLQAIRSWLEKDRAI